MTTDTSERGLKRPVCTALTALTGHFCTVAASHLREESDNLGLS